MYVRFPFSLRNVEDLLFERGIDICHETVRHWWNRFDPLFAADIRRQSMSRMRGFAIGVSISTRCASATMARWSTSGAPWITSVNSNSVLLGRWQSLSGGNRPGHSSRSQDNPSARL
jgi:hypothetical protein